MNGLPQLFLIGAPKCGTTSLAAWLASHPAIVLSNPKEPNYYAPDITAVRAADSRARYLRLFAPTAPGQIRVDASTTYLRSRVAAARIRADIPQARFVVCLRNPIEMAPSVHAQLVRAGREPIPDFELAWRMQARRRQLRNTRMSHHNPADWQYAQMCRLGAQVAALLRVVPRDRVRFVFLEDLAAQPAWVYARVLGFAGLEDDGRQDFPAENTRRVPRVVPLARASHLAGSLRQRLGLAHGTGLGARVNRLNERRPAAADRRLASGLTRELADTFRQDIHQLARLTGRNLDHWLSREAGQ